jgi:hypothetical protein
MYGAGDGTTNVGAVVGKTSTVGDASMASDVLAAVSVAAGKLQAVRSKRRKPALNNIENILFFI